MAKKATPRAGELTTANYGWTKPTVGASVDAWGGYLNADLDGIDSTVKSVSNVANAAYPASNPSGYQTAAQVTAAIPAASSTTPAMDGTAAIGTATTWARADHVHPSASTTTTWNPSDLSAGITLSGGNLVAAVGGSGGGVRSIFGTSSGKYYFECAFGISGPSLSTGIANSSAILSSVSSTGANAAVANNAGTVAINGANMGTGLLGAFSAGGVCGIAIDLGAQLIWFRNGAAGNWNGSGTANPTTGTGGFSISALGSVALFALADGSGAPPGSITGNFGATAFVGTVPSGFTSGFYGSAYLPLSGGTMTGAMTLAADPAANLQPATKQYVDGVRYGDNRIINGDMRIDQRNNGAAGTAGGYTIDRWIYGASQASKVNWQRGGAIASLGFGGFMALTSLSAYALLAADTFSFSQTIEADMTSDFCWGTANAQPVTLSFWANASLAGTYSGSIANAAGTRSYPFTFLLAANTWAKIVVTVPGDTAGTWVMSGAAAGVLVRFDLGSGSTYRAAGGAWASGNYIGANGAASIVATNGANLNLTGVKLEIGSAATPYNRQSLAKSMADCQRYYQKLGGMFIGGYGASGSTVYIGETLPVMMRATPTATLGTITASNGCSTQTITPAGNNTVYFSMLITATGGSFFQADNTFSAEL